MWILFKLQMKSVLICILSSLIAMNAARDVSDKAVDFIKDYEKWRPCAYVDAVGKLTIGYGHLITSGDGFNKDSCITRAQGLELLRSDLSIAASCVERIVRVPLTDNQFGALVSWAFNVGCSAATKSTLVTKLNAGAEANEICTQLRRWNKGGGQVLPGLTKRREAECTLYKS